ncbi:MAG: AIR synthase family protein [Bacillota bacterium]
MQIGKLSSSRLQKTVLNKISNHRNDILVNSALGEDSAVIDFGEQVLAISSDPITGAAKNAGYLAVHVACNDLAATGAKPLGIQVVLLLPPEISDEEIKNLMTEIDETANNIGAQVLGGHTEILDQLDKPIIVVTAIGKADKNKYVSTGGSQVDDDIIITKGLGLEGAYILANDYPDLLKQAGISDAVIKRAESFDQLISVLPEGMLAAEFGVHSMHDITEGGLFGAIDEVSRASDHGFLINISSKVLDSAVAEIVEKLKLNPYALISSGSMLITTDKGDELVQLLEDKGIKAFKIGKIIETGQNVDNGKDVKHFDWDGRDELWKFIEKI